ncbi:MAG: DMT family transporter [Sphingobacteriales bacterium]|nr:DMT family transporter [Sphingobacteriales bacterium]MBI3717894.1 DMT family transporter [Sphingobacteriales bacterium]
MGYVLQFIAMASFGISNCLWAYPLKEMPVFLVIGIRAGLTSLLFLLLILLQYNFSFTGLKPFLFPVEQLSAVNIFPAIIFCSISYFGLFFFNKSIKYGAVSISIPILSFGSIIGIVAGILLYNESFTILKFIITTIFILGLWCIEKLNPAIWRLQLSKGVLYSLLATVFWSAGIFFPMAIKSLGVLWFSLVLELTVCVMSWAGLLIKQKGIISNVLSYPVKQNWKWIFSLAVCGFSGVLFSNLALFHLPLHILGMMGIIQPVVSLVVANMLLKEKLQMVQYAGVLLILLGMWLTI